MGYDTTCAATYKKQTSVGRAQLETDHVLFRGDFRVKLPLASITAVSTRGGVLSLKSVQGTLTLSIGPAAEKWAAKITSPPSRVQKLGVKPEMRVSVLGVADGAFEAELKAAGADVSTRLRRDSDQIYIAIESAADLGRFKTVLPSVKQEGAVWAIRRRGLKDASEAATMAAGIAAGLVDVKVARFSETHTAEKFVRPVASRVRRPADSPGLTARGAPPPSRRARSRP